MKTLYFLLSILFLTVAGTASGSDINAVFTCHNVTITTHEHDLSNVVLLFSDNSTQKFENLRGKAGTFLGTGTHTGKVVIGVWVKAGNNASGDCPGCGEYFASTLRNCPGAGTGSNGDVTADFTCTNVRIVAKTNKLCRVELLFSDSTTQVIDNINAMSGTFAGTGVNAGKTVTAATVNNCPDCNDADPHQHESDYVGDHDKSNPKAKKVTICHVPKGNPTNAHTIVVSENAAKAHIDRHGGDYYGPCKGYTSNPCQIRYFKNDKDCPSGGSAQITVGCEELIASATVNIVTVTLLYDDSSTQSFVINAKTANVAPIDEFEGYFIYGAYVQLEGEAGMGTFYANPNFEVCEDERPPLPVKLTKFEAKKIAPSVVQLNWATAQEINNDYIAIEKSADIENWKEVCRVPGHGTSNQAHEYTCTDHQADEHGQNVVYYRPKQVDYNGTYEYFSTIRVRLQDAAYATTVDKAYPNPTKDRLNIRYNTAENGVFNIRLVGMDGKTLVQNKFVARPGTQVIDIDLMENKLKPGVYLLEIHTENEVFHQKVYKQ